MPVSNIHYRKDIAFYYSCRDETIILFREDSGADEIGMDQKRASHQIFSKLHQRTSVII